MTSLRTATLRRLAELPLPPEQADALDAWTAFVEARGSLIDELSRRGAPDGPLSEAEARWQQQAGATAQQALAQLVGAKAKVGEALRQHRDSRSAADSRSPESFFIRAHG